MTQIALPSAPADLVEALTARGARVTTGQDIRSAVAAISPRLHAGDIDVCLLVRPSGQETDMVEVWARAMAPFVSARFVGIGQWGLDGSWVEPGCSLADLLEAVGLEPRDGDTAVIVGADGSLDRPVTESPEPPAAEPQPVAQEASARATGRSRSPWGGHRDRTWADPPARPAPHSAGGRHGQVFSPWGATRSHETPPKEPDWSRVLLLVSGRGGVGRSTMSIAVAERAAGHLGRNVVLVDANVGQAGLATNLRVFAGGSIPLPTIADLSAGAAVQQVVAGPDQVRRAGGTRVSFAAVLAPDPDQATGDACSPGRYRQVIDRLAPVSDLIVVDTCVAWQGDPTSITTDLIAPGLRAGASVLVVTDPSLEGVAGARRLVSWATRLAPGRVSGLLNKVPASAAPDPAEASRLFAPAPCLAVVPHSDTVAVAAAKGRPVGRLTGLAADKVLAHLGVA